MNCACTKPLKTANVKHKVSSKTDTTLFGFDNVMATPQRHTMHIHRALHTRTLGAVQMVEMSESVPIVRG